jgi:hypothetical protein
MGYLRWVSANRLGFVINIRRNLNPIDARTHHASCRSISGENPRAGPWTGMYIKLCSADIGALDQWANGASKQAHHPVPVMRVPVEYDQPQSNAEENSAQDCRGSIKHHISSREARGGPGSDG